jgi:hypothetical protein
MKRLIASIAIIVATSTLAACSSPTQSYSDGHSFGVQEANTWANDGDAAFGGIAAAAPTACNSNLPSGDNQSQWTEGCIAGFSSQFASDDGLVSP